MLQVLVNSKDPTGPKAQALPSFGKMAWDGHKWGRECFFPANPDLADILGDMDFDLENASFLLCFLDSQIIEFLVPQFWISPNLDFPTSQNLDFPLPKIWISQSFSSWTTKGNLKKKQCTEIDYFPWWTNGPYSPGLGSCALSCCHLFKLC